MKKNEDKKLMTKADICEYLAISDSTLFRLRRDKVMPKPLSLGERVIRWQKKDIDIWLESITPEQPSPTKYKVHSKRSLN
jgi:predicted DNA-binding transcriptional regulator AlpA